MSLSVDVAYIHFLRLYAWPNGLECVEEKEYTRTLYLINSTSLSITDK